MHAKHWTISFSAAAIMLLVGAYGTASFGAPAADAAKTLTGAQEVPPVDTKASGVCNIVVGSDMSVTGSVTTMGIDGTMAHIHQGAPGVSGPPVVTLVKTSDTQWSVPPDTKLTAAQYQSYKAGELYVNVHSAAHKSGEIRVQLKP
jgi:hypothetical protein